MKKQTKKLQLGKITIAQLTDNEQVKVVGGLAEALWTGCEWCGSSTPNCPQPAPPTNRD